MIRVVAIALVVLAVWAVLRVLVRFIKRKDIDWPGVAFIIGFVMLAFWLHGATGFGYLYG